MIENKINGNDKYMETSWHMYEDLVTLPSKDEMFERLNVIHISSELKEDIFPLLLEDAGKQMLVSGALLMLSHTLNKTNRDLGNSKNETKIFFTEMEKHIPEFISAIITNKEALKVALSEYKKTIPE